MHRISVVIPTRNEEKNIAQLLSQLNFASTDLNYDPIVVDDSTDKTAEVAKGNGARVIEGQGKGLGQAIVDGIKASDGDIVVVMDSDLSHNPHSLPDLIKPILEQGYDMTIGSRYCKGGSNPGWSLKRRIISRTACLLTLPLASIKDSTSGFFAFKKSILKGIDLRPTSWKVMLEVLIKARPTRVIEVPITFKDRYSGESKFEAKQTIAYVRHLGELYRWELKNIFQR